MQKEQAYRDVSVDSLPFPPGGRTKASKLQKVVHAHSFSHSGRLERLECPIRVFYTRNTHRNPNGHQTLTT